MRTFLEKQRLWREFCAAAESLHAVLIVELIKKSNSSCWLAIPLLFKSEKRIERRTRLRSNVLGRKLTGPLEISNEQFRSDGDAK
jgi:hypothetical protein